MPSAVFFLVLLVIASLAGSGAFLTVFLLAWAALTWAFGVIWPIMPLMVLFLAFRWFFEPSKSDS